ncbi:hypothetical protein [Zobellia uliginosa]|uniref:hypothetical protein n=1 Tax=Zobellia uliginosa TaxID=143224 RepID=UPI0026E2177B|nr:hypothetical protein [Zobellia uliginosa]MDO6519381.1 hypothetical protein [Zobellia uliginosa]
MNIEKRHKIISEIFDSYLIDIEKRIENHSYPKSMLTIYSKVLQIELIKKSLDNSDENFYSSQVLLRILLEHYLVGYYMYFKTTTDKNDRIGEEYYEEYLKSEIMKRENYYFKLDTIKGNPKHENIQGYLEKYGVFEDMKQGEINTIHQRASQFGIGKIIKYLFDHEKATNEEKEMHSMLFDFLEKYNKLSSYVHGGVSAEAETFSKEDESKRQDKIQENKEWGLSIEFSIKFYFLFLLNNKNPAEIIKLQNSLEK